VHVEGTKETISRCSPYAHLPQPGICRAPCHLTFLVINVELLLRLFTGELSAPPPTSPFYERMTNNKPESFVGALCVSWVFYRDAQQRDDRGDTVDHPQFFARIAAPNQDTFIVRIPGARSSCAFLARSWKRHEATLTPPLWEDVCTMSEEPQSERHCATKSISQETHPKIGSSKC
jgi:hypothetical protein